MKKIVLWILTCILLISTLTSIGANDQEKKIDELVAQVLKEAKVPGIAIAVTSEDGILISKGYGAEVRGSEVPMTENTVSGIGSLTKSFTALAILQQVEKGSIKLEDHVIDYLTEFKTFDSSKSNQITIAMLINNSSGLPHNVDYTIWEKNEASTDYNKTLKQFENVKLAFDPGTSYSYSNDGFMLAGMILEKVTGKKYEQIIEEDILKPLDMLQSTTDLTQISSKGGLYGHLALINDYVPAEESYMGLMLPAGSEFRSSVKDMSHYAQMMLNQGKYKAQTILEETTFKQYEAEGVVPFEMYDLDLSYSAGWMHLNDTPYVFHGGQTMTMSAMLIMDTKSKVAVTVLYNVADVVNKEYSPLILAMKILSLYNGKNLLPYQKLPDPVLKENTHFLEDDPRILGDYQSETGLMQMTVVNDGGLIGKMSNEQGLSEYQLTMISDIKGYINNAASEGLMEIIRGANNEVVALIHPIFGWMNRVNTEPLSGYVRYKVQDYKLEIFEDMEIKINGSGQGFRLVADQVQLEFTKGDWSQDLFALPKEIEILDQSSVRESVNAGKKCSEQILVYQNDEELMALIRIGIEGDFQYTLEGTMPFEQLTEIRGTQILTMIQSLTEGL